jgi:G3E family GTPase
VRWFDRVIIETTGIADPIPILQTIIGDERVSSNYFLANVVTVVDAINGALTLQEYSEAEKQVAVADRILVTKSDLPDVDLEGLHAAIAELAPLASLNKVTNGRVDVGWFLKSEKLSLHDKAFDFETAESGEVLLPISHNSGDHHHNLNRHGGIQASCLVFEHPVDPVIFEACLEMLMAFRGPDLLRMKGIINVAGMDRPMVIHSVQHVFHPPEILEQWPGDDRRTRLVIIARGLDHCELRGCFAMIDAAG